MSSPGYSHVSVVSGVELVNLFCPLPVKAGIILTLVPFLSNLIVWRTSKGGGAVLSSVCAQTCGPG